MKLNLKHILLANAMLLCMLAFENAHAAEPRGVVVKNREVRPTFLAMSFKEQLAWLRTITVKGFAPKSGLTNSSDLRWNDVPKGDFDAERQLFKAPNQDYRRDTLETASQPLGFHVSRNLQLQWDVDPFQARGEAPEVGLKLGVQLAFR